MTERREIYIEELDEGFIVRLDWRYMERSRGAFEPRDRKVIAATLDEAFEAAQKFMSDPVELALVNSK